MPTEPDAAAPAPNADGPNPQAKEADDALPFPIVKDGAGDVSARRAASRMRLLWLLAPMVGLLLTGAVVGLYFQPPLLQFLFGSLGLEPGGGTTSPIATRAAPKPDTTRETRPAYVLGLGKLVPAGDVVVVSPPFGAADARIASMRVREGDRVAKGDALAVLDSEAQYRAAIESARATVAAREAALAQTLASVRASRDESDASLRRAGATAKNAQRELDRIERLYRNGFATLAALDQKRTARDETAREMERAKAALSRWDRPDASTQPDVVVAQRNIEAAKANLLRAESDLDKAFVRAPASGTVLKIHSKVGERPGAAGVMDIGDIDRMTAEIEVYQSQIARVAPGAAVDLDAEAFPGPLKATVSRIGLEVGRQVLTDPAPAANTDARVVKVYADLDPDSSRAARNYTHLQVTARIAAAGAP